MCPATHTSQSVAHHSCRRSHIPLTNPPTTSVGPSSQCPAMCTANTIPEGRRRVGRVADGNSYLSTETPQGGMRAGPRAGPRYELRGQHLGSGPLTRSAVSVFLIRTAWAHRAGGKWGTKEGAHLRSQSRLDAYASAGRLCDPDASHGNPARRQGRAGLHADPGAFQRGTRIRVQPGNARRRWCVPLDPRQRPDKLDRPVSLCRGACRTCRSPGLSGSAGTIGWQACHT